MRAREERAGRPLPPRAHAVVTARAFNSSEASARFNYRNGSSHTVHQVVWENEQTLGLKYALAARSKLRGVGMWRASGRYPDQAPATTAGLKRMWDAVVDNWWRK